MQSGRDNMVGGVRLAKEWSVRVHHTSGEAGAHITRMAERAPVHDITRTLSSSRTSRVGPNSSWDQDMVGTSVEK